MYLKKKKNDGLTHKIKENIVKIKKFTYLDDIDHKHKTIINAQLEEIKICFIEKLKEKMSTQQKIVLFLKMQFPIEKIEFSNLDVNFKIKIFCFIFLNYMDRIRAVYSFGDFFPSLLICNVDKQKLPKR